VGHIACMVYMNNNINIGWKVLQEESFDYVGIDGMIILK
jgi:hypothetical protein